MKTNGHRLNWLIDAALFAGFVLACFLDLTGLDIHQWLGLVVGGLALYHLWRHWAWVAAAARRFGSSLASRARLYALIDLALFADLGVIILTGLIISSWLNLPLSTYAAWHTVHVWSTLLTLGVLVLKIGLHWRWIVSTFRGRVPVRPPAAPAVVTAKPVAAAASAGALSRRDFLGVMGVTTLAALLASTRVLDVQSAVVDGQVAATANGAPEQSGAATATATSVPTQSSVVAVVTPTSVPTQSSAVAVATDASAASTCRVQCNRRCSYPGHCRRYTDANNNGRCDWGECA
jgi:hypothetical protein